MSPHQGVPRVAQNTRMSRRHLVRYTNVASAILTAPLAVAPWGPALGPRQLYLNEFVPPGAEFVPPRGS
ncbi:MAG: hypothetical protein HY725_16390 [Candidatus Rokubacteria bacterium]|nr:hypothetical protein [Candidatus Rokubacteria bacterium]